jgi:hypothetical protein
MVLSVDHSELDSNIFVVSRRASERASNEIVLSLDQSELDTNIIILVSRSVFRFFCWGRNSAKFARFPREKINPNRQIFMISPKFWFFSTFIDSSM